MEPFALPPGARLTWLVGPPGAGKSTFIGSAAHGFRRVVELNDMLGPLVGPPRIRKGILEANGRLVDLIRRIERHEDNRCLSALLIVVGLAPESAIFPLSEDEVVWLLLPPLDRWRLQLYERPVNRGGAENYDDYCYSETWYARLVHWLGREGVHRLDVPFEQSRVGRVATETP